MIEFSLLEVVEFGCKGRYIGEKISYVKWNSCQCVRLPIHSMNLSRQDQHIRSARPPGSGVVDGRSRGQSPDDDIELGTAGNDFHFEFFYI